MQEERYEGGMEWGRWERLGMLSYMDIINVIGVILLGLMGQWVKDLGLGKNFRWYKITC
jgi:hypothetical protein